ncbi:uncharacterized protein LOC6556689 [Drosophila grimshawi]|uniref:GH15751 n=1 Tax=Drosophila grimshawi TaxID=7222 RepID=B4IYL1_DROGR|nr:uncharacterized protein LOC6556689 [Drosophila grimshawi]EDV95521.1 GH15751 [Drosophila grimshawi]
MLEQDTRSLKKDSTSIFATNWAQNGGINLDWDSCDSIDNTSDPVAITIDGEQHWVSGIDSNTTCTNLIWALLHYQEFEEKRCSDNNLNRSTNIPSQMKLTTNTKENKQTSYSSKDSKNSYQYVIVKQLRDSRFEEYLDGSTRILDVVSPNKQCELQLRHLVEKEPTDGSSRVNNQKQQQMFSMLSMSTDNDSGMGSPVASSRSERFRRRRGKQRCESALCRASSALPTPNMPQPLNYCIANPNERIMNIILTQDETINRQIYLLNEKEQEIMMIEDEKHRVRERKLSKNYMLDAYLDAPERPAQRKRNVNNQKKPRIQNSNLDTLITESGVESNRLETFWLERTYALNKLLHREEEQLLSLHAKIRKHQMRFAYHTKDEVLQQIDRLDSELSNQVDNIYKTERQLLIANEQLKAKLSVLECLGYELDVMPFTKPEIETETDLATDRFKSALNCQSQKDTDDQHCLKSFFSSQHLIEKNSTVLDQKTLKKRMFSAVDNPSSETRSDWCYQNREWMLDFDVEHFGTLV